LEYLQDTATDILLIEDNPHDAELTVRALRKKGLAQRLLVLQDGAEALDFLFGTGAYADRDRNSFPKVILLDLKLPKISGLEVLRQIKADERIRVIPVVVLTSSEQDSDIMESYRLGANSYIVKPVDYDKFFQAVADVGWYWLFWNRAAFSSSVFA
jgi:two-component system response regulator